MIKDLENLVEISHSKIKWTSLNSTNCTYPISEDIDNAIVLDFKNITNPEDLTVSGFDSICATCDKHYSVIFTPGSEIKLEESGYKDIFLTIGIDDIELNEDINFAKFLFNTISKFDKFKNHYTQYYYEGTKLYIYDYRGTSSTQNIHFFTQIYKIPVDITATYDKDVPLGYNINLEYLKIYVRYSTYEEEEISFEKCEITNTLVTELGLNNIVKISYQNKKFNLIINGIKNLISIAINYIGGTVRVNENGFAELNKDYFKVLLTTVTDGEQLLESKDFTISPEFVTNPVTDVAVIYSNEYENIIGHVTIVSDFGISNLMVWYEGEDIIAGNNYNPSDLIICLINSKGNFEIINFQDERIDLDSTLVLDLGINWFTCTFIENGQKVQDIFCVNGIRPDAIIDKNLQIMYIKNKVNTLNLDVTETFRPYLEIDNILYVSLKNFLKACNELFYYDGIFKVTMPANTGFNTRFASIWMFYVLDGKCIKAKQLKEIRY